MTKKVNKKAILKSKPAKAKSKTRKDVSQLIPTKRLLARPEGLKVDFKRDAESVKPDDLVAFANGGGGTILIGVDEIKGANGVQRGKIVGCDASDRERNKIVSRANSCRPAIPVTITVETSGKLAIIRVDIQKGGLHCTSNGTYKIHRDGQNDIIDPTLMAEIIVQLERGKILGYLRAAVRPEIEGAKDDMQSLYEDALSEIEDLRAELEDARNDTDYDHDY
ncbi:MAG: hypothetical protein C3F07_19205 [Anaerolineales bacterium]|nr:MAG: hypothetical protein C3F07_19205 [Anaerolineales bacterium]